LAAGRLFVQDILESGENLKTREEKSQTNGGTFGQVESRCSIAFLQFGFFSPFESHDFGMQARQPLRVSNDPEMGKEFQQS
jgi:hypothetical protein